MTNRLFVTLGLAGVLLLAAAGCDLLGGEDEGEPLGRIVFTHWDSTDTKGRAFVYTMNTDGSDLTRLSFQDEKYPCDSPRPGEDNMCGTGRAYSPRWSPNGKRIVYVDGGIDAAHIMMMNADGSEKRAITFAGGHADKPRWSPDGERLLYRQHSWLGIVIGTFVMDADDGSGKTCITCIQNAEGDVPPPITFRGDTLGADNAQWGPTSDLLYIFGRSDPPERDIDNIYLFRISSREVIRKVTSIDSLGRGRSYKISPDGHKMLFARGIGGDERIYLSSPLDTSGRLLTTGSPRGSNWGDIDSNWGDYSRHFVYAKFVRWESDNGGGKNHIYLADVKGQSGGRRVSSEFGRYPDIFIP